MALPSPAKRRFGPGESPVGRVQERLGAALRRGSGRPEKDLQAYALSLAGMGGCRSATWQGQTVLRDGPASGRSRPAKSHCAAEGGPRRSSGQKPAPNPVPCLGPETWHPLGEAGGTCQQAAWHSQTVIWAGQVCGHRCLGAFPSGVETCFGVAREGFLALIPASNPVAYSGSRDVQQPSAAEPHFGPGKSPERHGGVPWWRRGVSSSKPIPSVSLGLLCSTNVGLSVSQPAHQNCALGRA